MARSTAAARQPELLAHMPDGPDPLREIHFVRYASDVTPSDVMSGARLLREKESREAILRGDCGCIFSRNGSYDVCLEPKGCKKHKRKDVTEHAPLTAARIVKSLAGAEIAATVLAESRQRIVVGECGVISAHGGDLAVCDDTGFPCPKHKASQVLTIVTATPSGTTRPLVRYLTCVEVNSISLDGRREREQKSLEAIASGKCGVIRLQGEICEEPEPCPFHPESQYKALSPLAEDAATDPGPITGGSSQDVAANDDRPRIRLDALLPSPTNPRRKGLDTKSLAPLADSIKERGVELSILIRPIPPIAEAPSVTDEIVCGERRYRASRIAGETTIPYVRRTLTDQQVVEIQLLELATSEGVDPIDQADAMHVLATTYHMTLDAIAVKVGLPSADVVRRRLALHDLCPEAREILGKLEQCEPERALIVAGVSDPAGQVKAADFATKPRWHGEPPPSIAECRRWVRQNVMLLLHGARWKLDDAALVPDAGACSTCPKNTASVPALFGDIPEKDALCTDPACWDGKAKALFQLRVEQAKEKKNVTVLSETQAKKVLSDVRDEPTYNSGYKSLDEKEYVGGKEKTVRALLKGQDVPLTIAPGAAGPIEMVREEDLRKALKKIAPAAAKELGGSDEDDKQRRKKQLREEKIKRETTKRMIAAIVTAAEKTQPDDEWWRWVLNEYADSGHHDTVVAVAKRRGLDPKKAGEALKKLAKGMPLDELRGLAIEVLVTSGAYNPYYVGAQTNLKAAAEMYDVDGAAIGKQVRAEFAEAKKAKGKPAKKSRGKADADDSEEDAE